MAAELQPDPPSSDTINRRIAATIRAFVAANNTKPEELAPRLNMSRSSYYRHLREGDWSAVEISLIADYFKVSVASIYEGHVTVICGYPATTSGGAKGAKPKRDRRRRLRRAADRERFQVFEGGRQVPSVWQPPLIERAQ